MTGFILDAKLFQKFSWEILNQPPHKPDLPPSDYFFFTKKKEHLSRTTSSSDSDVETAYSELANGVRT